MIVPRTTTAGEHEDLALEADAPSRRWWIGRLRHRSYQASAAGWSCRRSCVGVSRWVVMIRTGQWRVGR